MVAFNFCCRFLQQTWATLDNYAPVDMTGIGSGINRNKKPSGASVTVTAVCGSTFYDWKCKLAESVVVFSEPQLSDSSYAP